MKRKTYQLCLLCLLLPIVVLGQALLNLTDIAAGARSVGATKTSGRQVGPDGKRQHADDILFPRFWPQ